jgi:hypothetical protein
MRASALSVPGWAGIIAWDSRVSDEPAPERVMATVAQRRRTATRISVIAAPAGLDRNASRSAAERIRSSWATIGASASTSSAGPSIRVARQAPWAAGACSAMIASNVEIARARRSSSARPSREAALGISSPIRCIGWRRLVTSDGPTAGLPRTRHRRETSRRPPGRRWSRRLPRGAPPTRWRSPSAPGRGRRGWSSSRTPGAAP